MTPPLLRHFLLFAFLFIPDCKLHGWLLPAVASESVDNGTNEQILVDLPSSEAGEASSLRRDSPPFSTSVQSSSEELNPTIHGDFDTRSDDVDRLEIWPWGKNATSSPTITPVDTSCIAHASCDECNSMTCHWCSFDDQCHAKGSPYGCSIGTNCKPKNDTKPDDPIDKSCFSHVSCTDCVLSSNLCHWCAFDDACHAIGSWYGCAHGTDCYANDRCQRRTPDPITVSMFSDIGFLPIFLIASIGVCTFFCSSVVYSGVRALKGAYEDLGALADARAPSQDELPGVNVDSDYSGEILLQIEDKDDEEEEEEVAKCEAVIEVLNNSVDTESQSLVQQHHTPLVTAHPDPSRMPRGRIGSQNITCLLKVCQAWYIFTVIGTILFVTLSFYCFPRMPQYNLCSDELAWKSIIDGLTSLKMEASFELLLSIENKNHLNIELEGFAGKIAHDGGEVGSFELPQSTIAASSITDVLVTCTVVPNKWEALGLIAQYYKGNLILAMSVNGAVKVSGIEYSFPVKETDVIVRVNDPSTDDRHLCACPEWKDMYPTMSPIPKFLADSDQKSALTIF